MDVRWTDRKAVREGFLGVHASDLSLKKYRVIWAEGWQKATPEQRGHEDTLTGSQLYPKPGSSPSNSPASISTQRNPRLRENGFLSGSFNRREGG